MANPRHIYAVRHCERMDDTNEVWYLNSTFGRDNPPLSKNGEKQAQDLKEKFRNIHFDYCFSSPYERCIQTASKILKGRINACLINVEPGFLEAGYLIREHGATEATFQNAKELARRYPNIINTAYKPFYLAPFPEEMGNPPPNGIRCCFPRIHHTMKQVLKICDGDILIVTHKHPLGAIQSFLVPSDKQPLYPGPGTVSKYEEQPGPMYGQPKFTAAYLGDGSHFSTDTNTKNHRGGR